MALRKHLVLMTVAIFPSMEALGQSASPAKIESYLESIYAEDEPGAAVIVVHNGEVVYRGAHGLANLEHDVPLSPDSIFPIASVTKQFTAAAIMILEDQGEIGLEDTVTKFFSDFPRGNEITIRHLLTHTSGLFEVQRVPGILDTAAHDVPPQFLIDLFKDRELDFPPGEQDSYTNSGYILLGAIIEAVSGKGYGEFLHDEIFEPLGMFSSGYMQPREVIPGRVYGYTGTSGTYQNELYFSPTQAYSAGGVRSSIDDLATWDRALVEETVPNVSYETMGERTTKLNNGGPVDYGFGMYYFQPPAGEAVGHGGGAPGFNSVVFRIRSHDFFVAVLSNNKNKDPNQLVVAGEISGIVLTD